MMQIWKKLLGSAVMIGGLAGWVGPVLADDKDKDDDDDDKIVDIEVFTPERREVVGVGSKGFIVDLLAIYQGDLASTGASLELTGPGPQANTGPFPGTFGLGANKDHFPGLVVLLSSTQVGAGPGHNLSNLFNIVGVTERDDEETYIWTTWIIGAANVFGFVGEMTPSRLFVAVVDGVAPDVVEDMDGNGKLNKKDLKMMGYKVISNTPKVNFVVNGFD